MTFSPDGETLAVSGCYRHAKRCHIQLWDVSHRFGNLLASLHQANVDKSDLVFSPDGNFLLETAGGFVISPSLLLYDVSAVRKSGEVKFVSGRGGGSHEYTYLPRMQAAFSPDGQELVLAGPGDIQVYEVNQLDDWLPYNVYVRDLIFSPDGSTLGAVGGESSVHTVRLWDVTTGDEQAIAQNDLTLVNEAAFSSDLSMLALGTWDDEIYLWDVIDDNLLFTLEKPSFTSGYVEDLAFSPDNRLLASSSFKCGLFLWDISQRKLMQNINTCPYLATRIIFNPNGEWLAYITDSLYVWNPSIHLVNLNMALHPGEDDATGERTVIVGYDRLFGMTFSPDGRLLITNGSTFQERPVPDFRLWTIDAKGYLHQVANIDVSNISHITFHPNQDLLFARASYPTPYAGDLRVYDLSSVNEPTLLRSINHPLKITTIAVSGDGKLVATGSLDGAIRLWGIPAQ